MSYWASYWAGLVLVIAAIYVGWRTLRPRSSAFAFKPQPAREPARSPVIEPVLRRPSLPAGVEAAVVAALRAGRAPDEAWMTESEKDDSSIRILRSGRFQSVAGENFSNPNGVARQSLIAATEPGAVVWLAAEPDNQYDPDAVSVFVDRRGGETGHIAYLPRNHNLSSDIAAGKVAAWFASKGRPEPGAPLGAVLYLVVV